MDAALQANAAYSAVVSEYIESNSPHKVGDELTITDVGVRLDYTYLKERGRVLKIGLLSIKFKPDGDPLIMASGEILKYSKRGACDVEGSFECVIHGSLAPVQLQKYRKIGS